MDVTVTGVEESADARAHTAILAHHAALRRGVEERVAALADAVRSGASHEPTLTELREYLTGEVLPHAAAEETVLYPAAAQTHGTFIDAMLFDHRLLTDGVRRLDEAPDDVGAVAVAAGVAAVFALHVRKENEILLPALLDMPGVALSTLLSAMEHQLHDRAAAGSELDVRSLPHGPGRHQAIFGRLDRLAPGEALVIVNDHDPQPLHYQIDAAWPDTFDWHYQLRGPDEWRIAITRRP